MSEEKEAEFLGLKPKAELKKHQQLIWLSPDRMAKVYELSAKYGLAPNVVCGRLVEKALDAMESGEWQPAEGPPGKVEVKEVEIYRCPACLIKFPADPKEGGLEAYVYHIVKDNHFFDFLERWAFQHEGRLKNLEERLKALKEMPGRLEGKVEELKMVREEAGAKP
jgi:hypothetical protein